MVLRKAGPANSADAARKWLRCGNTGSTFCAGRSAVADLVPTSWPLTHSPLNRSCMIRNPHDAAPVADAAARLPLAAAGTILNSIPIYLGHSAWVPRWDPGRLGCWQDDHPRAVAGNHLVMRVPARTVIRRASRPMFTNTYGALPRTRSTHENHRHTVSNSARLVGAVSKNGVMTTWCSGTHHTTLAHLHHPCRVASGTALRA